MNLSDSWADRQPTSSRVGAAEAVLADLRAAIENGDLPVGTKLPAEATLSARYSVSRSVVREALRSSTALGFTETHTGKGTFVISDRPRSEPVFGEYSAGALREARPHIEVPAAGFAALRRTDVQLAQLRELVDRMDAETDPAEGFDSTASSTSRSRRQAATACSRPLSANFATRCPSSRR